MASLLTSLSVLPVSTHDGQWTKLPTGIGVEKARRMVSCRQPSSGPENAKDFRLCNVNAHYKGFKALFTSL